MALAMPSVASRCARAKAILQVGIVMSCPAASAATATASLLDSSAYIGHRPPNVIIYHRLGFTRLELAIMAKRIIMVYFDSFTRANRFVCMEC
jgi:hypothetical protein